MAFPGLEWDGARLSVPSYLGPAVWDALVAGGMVQDVDFGMYFATQGRLTPNGLTVCLFLFTGDKGNEVLAKLIL
jgi:hypothetical protein